MKYSALIRHAVLDRDPAAELRDALDVAVGDGLGVIDDPVQAAEWNVAIDLLEDVERARDRLIVGRVQAPGPTVRGEQPDDRLEIAFHRRRQVGALDLEILVVGGAVDQHLAAPLLR